MNPKIIEQLKTAEAALRAALELTRESVADQLPPPDPAEYPRPGVGMINLSTPELMILTALVEDAIPSYRQLPAGNNTRTAFEMLLNRVQIFNLAYITLSQKEENLPTPQPKGCDNTIN